MTKRKLDLSPGSLSHTRRRLSLGETTSTRVVGEEAESSELLPVGTEFAARYRLERCLGRGGQGVVYQALDLESGRQVAVKVSPTRRESLPILIGVHHKHLQRLLDWGHQEEGSYLVLRHYPCAAGKGETLFARLEAQGPLPLSQVGPWIAQILSGLDYLHSHGIVHRDVKPANVLLCDERAVLIDFDLACELPAPKEQALNGSPSYLSRQRLEGEPATPADDLFAAAVSLYQLLDGALPSDPWRPTNVSQLWEARAHGVLPLGQPALDALLERALALDPRERFPNARAFSQALQALSVPSERGSQPK
ncbi:MAG TPA: hypothetical protein DEA08_22050 [Planctomycetes bacterium]|nr:hypothetical protein [Planctomycetota bacterium]